METTAPTRQQPVRYKYLRHLLIAATFVAIFMTFFAGFIVYKYSKHDTRLRYYKDHLASTIKYYDENVSAEPIYKIEYLKHDALATACAQSSTVRLITDLYKWPSTARGCNYKSESYTGHCKNSRKSGKTIEATKPASSNFWKGGKFCVTTHTA